MLQRQKPFCPESVPFLEFGPALARSLTSRRRPVGFFKETQFYDQYVDIRGVHAASLHSMGFWNYYPVTLQSKGQGDLVARVTGPGATKKRTR